MQRVPSVRPATERTFEQTPSQMPVTPDSLERFTKTIQPLLLNRCTNAGCHVAPQHEGFCLDRTALVRESGPRTFGRPELPVYCAHCSVNNEMQAVEWRGSLTTVEHPPQAPGQPCVHEVYKRPDAVPEEAYVRIGKRPRAG